MKVNKIAYLNFRNIRDCELELFDNVTLITGMNGQGKTNLLEGIYLYATGRSFRTSREKDFLMFGEKDAMTSIEFFSDNRINKANMRWINGGEKRLSAVNGMPIKKFSELMGYFRAVLFCPQHLSLICDGPSERRSFLDIALSQFDRRYLSSLQQYNILLNQRNALLKSKRDNIYEGAGFNDTVDIISYQLSEYGAVISEKRAEYIEGLNRCIGKCFSDMTFGNEKPECVYRYPKTQSEIYEQLTANIDYEIRTGATAYGVHRDDIYVTLNGKEARYFASQGQQRSIALSMKLAEGELSKEKTGEYPVFLLDDVLSELDSERQHYILSSLTDRQIIITSCENTGRTQGVYTVKNGVASLESAL